MATYRLVLTLTTGRQLERTRDHESLDEAMEHGWQYFDGGVTFYRPTDTHAVLINENQIVSLDITEVDTEPA